MYLDHPSLSISFEKDIVLNNPSADAFMKNNDKRAAFHSSTFRRHANALAVEFLVCHLQQEQRKFPTLVLLLDEKIKQTKIISN